MHEGLITRVVDIQPIKGADRIVLARLAVGNIHVAEVVTGVDTHVGTLGVFFGPDIQLSEDFCNANNLTYKRDENGDRIPGTGYLDPDKRRIIAQRFKGVKSEGLFLPLSSLEFAFPMGAAEVSRLYSMYSEGDAVSTVEGKEICKRYPKRTIVVRDKTGHTTARTTLEYFPEHYDTDQLLHNLRTIEHIPVGARIIITEKLHGTSHRVGNVKVPAAFKWYHRLANWLAGAEVYRNFKYDTVHGTRRVVISPDTKGYYGDNKFRFDAVGTPLLYRDEMVYGELVGFAGDRPIMPDHSTQALKELKKAFGDTVRYGYGLLSGCQFYVYRMTRHNGIREEEYTWDEIVDRATELHYSVVPELWRGMWDGDTEALLNTIRSLAEKNDGIYSHSTLGNSVMEGVCIRFEHGGRTWVYKYKGYGFKVMEGIENAPNMEDEEG